MNTVVQLLLQSRIVQFGCLTLLHPVQAHFTKTSGSVILVLLDHLGHVVKLTVADLVADLHRGGVSFKVEMVLVLCQASLLEIPYLFQHIIPHKPDP